MQDFFHRRRLNQYPEVVASCEKHQEDNVAKVRYVVIGGYAVAYHGYVRYTGDLDVFVELSPENADRIVRALRSFGFDLPELRPSLFLRKGKIIRMGREPMRLEILNEIDGVSFDECYKQRRVKRLGTLKVNFIAG